MSIDIAPANREALDRLCRARAGAHRGRRAPGVVYDARAALGLVQREFIERLPGAAWKRP